MNPLVLPGEEARAAEVSDHHGQEILMERGTERRTLSVKGEEQWDEGPAAAPGRKHGGSGGMRLGQPASGGSLRSCSRGEPPRAERGGDLMWQNHRGKTWAQIPEEPGQRQGCLSTPHRPLGPRREVVTRHQAGERTVGWEAVPCRSIDGREGMSYLVRHPQICVPGQESLNDRIL